MTKSEVVADIPTHEPPRLKPQVPGSRRHAVRLAWGTGRRNLGGRRSTADSLPPLTSFDPPGTGWRSGIRVHHPFLYIACFIIVPRIKSVLQTSQLDATKYSLHSPPLSPITSVHSTHSFPRRYPPRESRRLPKNGWACLTYTHQKV